MEEVKDVEQAVELMKKRPFVYRPNYCEKHEPFLMETRHALYWVPVRVVAKLIQKGAEVYHRDDYQFISFP